MTVGIHSLKNCIDNFFVFCRGLSICTNTINLLYSIYVYKIVLSSCLSGHHSNTAISAILIASLKMHLQFFQGFAV